MTESKPVTYADSGVHLESLDAVKVRIGKAVSATHGPQVLSRHGAFGGLFSLTGLACEEPVLVSSVDGVGTKVKVAQQVCDYSGLGHDIVNHCIDDILVCGARPLFFLDYFAAGQMDPRVVEAVITSIAGACKQAGMALLAGETAEMPGVYVEGEFDIAGTIVGVVDRKAILDGSRVGPGDVILGLPSNGLHTNGYSLARRVLVDAPGRSLTDAVPGTDMSVGAALLEPHTSYLAHLSAIRGHDIDIHALVHITGGGYEGNIRRVLPDGCKAVIDTHAWDPLPIFKLIQEAGPVEPAEMYRVFNMGIGMVVVLPPHQVEHARIAVPEAVCIGCVEEGEGIELQGLPAE